MIVCWAMFMRTLKVRTWSTRSWHHKGMRLNKPLPRTIATNKNSMKQRETPSMRILVSGTNVLSIGNRHLTISRDEWLSQALWKVQVPTKAEMSFSIWVILIRLRLDSRSSSTRRKDPTIRSVETLSNDAMGILRKNSERRELMSMVRSSNTRAYLKLNCAIPITFGCPSGRAGGRRSPRSRRHGI